MRAYTLRLHGLPHEGEAWKDALWLTHTAMNYGARLFGDFLLTLRGGLAHTLVEELPDPDLRKSARLVMVLSWLSVESQEGSPEQFRVERTKTIPALREILNKRGVSGEAAEEWVKAAAGALMAEIREDAVWINRSMAFDELTISVDLSAARRDAQTLLWFVLGEEYLLLPGQGNEQRRTGKKRRGKAAEASSEAESDNKEAARDRLKVSSRGAGQRTRHPFSHLFGASAGFGQPIRFLELKEDWSKILRIGVETACGIPMIAGRMEDGSSSPAEFHRQMFSLAGARVAAVHTLLKTQEVERRLRESADAALREMEANHHYHDVLAVLASYVEERTLATGARERFTFRRRQLIGWEEVVEAWEAARAVSSHFTAEDAERERVEEARRLQGESADGKFGDATLFADLAAERFLAVWHDPVTGRADATVLLRFATGEEARAQAKRLKINAYRHPNPYYNPVFCQYGVSSPKIEFERLRENVEMKEADARLVRLLVWTGERAEMMTLKLASNRFEREIGSRPAPIEGEQANSAPGGIEITRRTKLAAVAAGATDTKSAPVAGIFAKAKVRRFGQDRDEMLKPPAWNGTVLVSRRALRALGEKQQAGGGSLSAEQKPWRGLRWRLTVSLELEPRGPWLNYLETNEAAQATVRLDQRSDRFVASPARSTERWRGLVYPFWHADNTKGRRGLSKHGLSRLGGLRVMGVELGVRHSAACAVWETVSTAEVERACAEARAAPPKNTDTYLHLHTKKRTIIYRRIGDDLLPDGVSLHPAPWARLEDQFVVKLPGEERPARKAGAWEAALVEQLEQDWGYVGGGDNASRMNIDALMARAVRVARWALGRHSDACRIARAFVMTELYGDKGARAGLDEEGRVELLTNALNLWSSLLRSTLWRNEWAREQWAAHIAPLFEKEELKILEGVDESEWAAEEHGRRKRRRARATEEFREILRRGVRRLLNHEQLPEMLHALWRARWEEDDLRWRQSLRLLRDFVMGRRQRSAARWRVGGLSLARLGTIRELWKIQKAFFARLQPDDRESRSAPTDFGARLLEDAEQMRAVRTKSLASMIVSAALGHVRYSQGSKVQAKRECVQAIIVGDLTNYRPDQTRSRRENRQLVEWSTAETLKHLAESCVLHGLHLRSVAVSNTSRSDSRTGYGGMKVMDVSVRRFVQPRGRYLEMVKRARERIRKNAGNMEDDLLVELYSRWNPTTSSWTDADGIVWLLRDEWRWTKRTGSDKTSGQAPRPVRLPNRLGEIFVSSLKVSPAAGGLQADLNAAANIGLKALLDPDSPVAWWMVPTEPEEHGVARVARASACAGSLAVESVNWKMYPHGDGRWSAEEVEPTARGEKADRRKGADKRVLNLWRDVEGAPLIAGVWREYGCYLRHVEEGVLQILLDSQRVETTV